MAKNELTNREKAAIFLIAIGGELSAKIMQHLPEHEQEILTEEIINIRNASPEVQQRVLNEFYEDMVAERYKRVGGIEYARSILEKSVGPEKAAEILARLSATPNRMPFRSLRDVDTLQLASYLQNELSQTIAVVMAHLSPEQAAVVLSTLPADQQADVIIRVATMERTSPELLYEVERLLERKLSVGSHHEQMQVGGVGWAVGVLNRVERSREREIMQTLVERNEELANEIKKKMFVFEDIVKLDDRTVQRIMRAIDMRDLPMALKGANEEVRRKVFNNISKRQVEEVKELLELMGAVRVRDVEEAQTRIVTVIRGLEEKGEIVIQRGDADEFIV